MSDEGSHLVLVEHLDNVYVMLPVKYNAQNSFTVGNLAQLVRALVMYCWRLGALFQGPGFESHWSVLFISHPNSLASDSREFISSKYKHVSNIRLYNVHVKSITTCN